MAGQWKEFLESVHRQNREILEKTLFKLTAAYRISIEASYASDLSKCLNILVDRIADLMSVEIVSIMLVDRYQKDLVIKIARGLDNTVTEQRVKIGKGIAGWIAKTGKPLLIKDITKDRRFPRRDGKRYYTNSLLSVPLKLQDEVIGVVNVNNKMSRGVFTEEDLGMLKTVSDLVAATIESARLQQEAKARDNVRFDFISNVSHELRTPLAAVKEAVSLVSESMSESADGKQKRLLELARGNIGRLERMIDELLDLARVESRITALRRRLFDITALIEDVVTSLKPLGRDKKIALKSKLPDKMLKIWGDPDKLNQVLTNLIDNAIKYNKPGGEVEVGLEKTGKSVRIYVSDNGIGIPEKEIDRVFDRFYRIERHIKGQARGAGIGLAITKDIIEKHGGRIRAESRPGRGSRFTITLPRDLRKEGGLRQ